MEGTTVHRVVLAIVLSLAGVLTPIGDLQAANDFVLSLSDPPGHEPSKEHPKPTKEAPKKDSPKEESPRKTCPKAAARLDLRRPRPAAEILDTQRFALLLPPARLPATEPPPALAHLRELLAPSALQVFRH